MSGGVVVTLDAETAAWLLAHVEEIARDSDEPIYGAFPGGDPRDFRPDEECSLPAEREAHRLACEAWSAGAQMPVDGAHQWSCEGGTIVHATRAVYGLGAYVYRDPALARLVQQLRAAVIP